jgi:FKBP-type peptidyl-prolyl cis-trans isomerase SlyD
MVKVGNVLPMTDSDGNQMRGSVQEITGEHVRMDFNHPLAGQDLHFAGEVLEIRDATKEELSHGHVHGPGGHHH